tara:strand:+ start:281 stop:718 length:438 start_codon:yes stop_codon:yes gene_type:complete
MSEEDDMDSEIPALVKKYVPGVTRGLSWAKYGKEKGKGTVMKSEAFREAKSEGFATALKAPSGEAANQILKEATEGIWNRAKKLTEKAKEVSHRINSQKSKKEREEVLGLAREAAKKAGVQAAIAAGWEQGWKEGIQERDSKNSD